MKTPLSNRVSKYLTPEKTSELLISSNYAFIRIFVGTKFDDYLASMVLWYSDNLKESPGNFLRLDKYCDIYTNYQSWCIDNKGIPLPFKYFGDILVLISNQLFFDDLRTIKAEKIRDSGGVWLVNLKLKNK